MVSVAVGLMVKAPVAGAVKTRLHPPLSYEQARDAAVAMLCDCAATVRSTGAQLWCVHTGPSSDLLPHVPSDARFLPQRGEGLGQRLANAQNDLHAAGHDQVVLLGADCPTVGPSYLRGAIAALDDHELVLGPAIDGGYTLIGSRTPDPGLFEVEMSTTTVLVDTLARAADLGRSHRVLAERTDLDTVGDLLVALEAGWLDHARHTRAVAEHARRLLEQSAHR